MVNGQLLELKLNIPKALAMIPGIATQIQFALSLGLNRTTEAIQLAEQSNLQRAFILRRPQFLLRAVAKIDRGGFSTKDKLFTRIHTDVDFLPRFEEGDYKSPRTGRSLAIPTTVLVGPGRRGIVAKGKRPAAFAFRVTTTRKGRLQIRGDQRTFIVPGMGIFQRVGRRGHAQGLKAQMQAGEIRLLYAFKKRVKLPPSLRWYVTAEGMADKVWKKNLGEAISYALATAR